MNVIVVISVPETRICGEIKEDAISIHLSSIVQLRNIHSTIDQSLKFIVINNERIIFNSIGSLKEVLETKLEKSKIERDLALTITGLQLRKNNSEAKNGNIVQGLGNLSPSSTKIFICSLYPVKFSNIFLNLRHILETADFNLRCFTPQIPQNDGTPQNIKIDSLSIISRAEECSIKNFLNFLLEKSNSAKNSENINFPVKCICHGKNMEIGFVCPVCLTPYCKILGICRSCKMKIAFK